MHILYGFATLVLVLCSIWLCAAMAYDDWQRRRFYKGVQKYLETTPPLDGSVASEATWHAYRRRMCLANFAECDNGH